MVEDKQFSPVGLLRTRRRIWGVGKWRIVFGVGGGGVLRVTGWEEDILTPRDVFVVISRVMLPGYLVIGLRRQAVCTIADVGEVTSDALYRQPRLSESGASLS
jgi:hypothetical protein